RDLPLMEKPSRLRTDIAGSASVPIFAVLAGVLLAAATIVFWTHHPERIQAAWNWVRPHGSAVKKPDQQKSNPLDEKKDIDETKKDPVEPDRRREQTADAEKAEKERVQAEQDRLRQQEIQRLNQQVEAERLKAQRAEQDRQRVVQEQAK